jgi:hypothetical protein
VGVDSGVTREEFGRGLWIADEGVVEILVVERKVARALPVAR